MSEKGNGAKGYLESSMYCL